MKSLLTKRIVTLMSITIILSAIAIAVVGVFLSEGMTADIRGKELLPDVSVLSEVTVQYQEGNLKQEVYETIVVNALGKHTRRYIIYSVDGSVLAATEDMINIDVEAQLKEALVDVFAGDEVFLRLEGSFDEPVELVGLPVVSDNEIRGAVFVLEDMVDIRDVKTRFYQSLFIAILIVIPIVEGISYYILMRIIKPIKNIVAVALSMVEGDFSIRADESLQGEIGFLGRTMNKLSIDLYKNISQLFIEKNRLQQVLNSLDEGMIAVDENKNITHYNYSFLEMFSLTNEMVSGKTLDDVVVVNDELHELNQAIEGRYPIIKNRSYNESILRISIAPIENEKKQVVGAVIIIRDITEVEKLEEMRREYVANVSHELRSPLTSIRGLIEPLMDSIVTNEADVKRYYEIIYKESLRLSRLVDDIMELSRLQTNESRINKTYVDLNTLIEMVYERYRLFDENIKLIYNPVELPKVFTNYDRIEQILVILIDNAYKFTPEGGRIEIIIEKRLEDVLVRVTDTGLGIEKEDIPFVFDRFYKSDKSRTKKGTGLGLSIAKEILTIMGEDIGVKSTIGVGSSFEFTIHLEEV